jgi:hypothetical protein
MAKRFTDSLKWDHAWYRRLSPKMKCVWSYLLDKCDSAGIWTVDLEAMSFNIGETVTPEEFEKAPFQDKLKWISSDKILITPFIEFQYGVLSEDCKPHRPVIERLRKLNLLKGYQKGFKTLEDKDKEKDQEKDQEKEKEKEEGSVRGDFVSASDLLELYALFPKKVGKTKGVERFKAQLKTRERFELAKLAVTKYRDYCQEKKIESQFVKQFDTFANCWEDCLDPEFGKSDEFAKSGLDSWAEKKRKELQDASA